ncbi:MAG: hypothetical protein JNG83_07250 [Opitutaceae bacterium]|nr:hypothetical protein [Opitutaceae bacterium]
MAYFRPTHRLGSIAALAAVIALPATGLAQTSANEDERLEALARDVEAYVPKSSLAVGFRVLSSGAKVSYGNLGSVPFANTAAPLSEGSVSRNYDNGAVLKDSLRDNEKDTNGNQTSTPGGRYTTTSTSTVDVKDADGNVIGTQDVTTINGDYLSYTPGLTRQWGYGSEAQLQQAAGYVAMSNYRAISEGGMANKKQGPNGGVEFELTRIIGRISGRIQWGLAAGVALNDINNKVGGSVLSTLVTQTDYYYLNGQTAPTAPYTGPSYVDLLDASGNVITTQGLETTTPISELPTAGMSTETITPGGVTVRGNWQVKGAYFMMRVGPALRAQLTERLGLNASLGVAGAYSGTKYTAVETFDVPNVTDAVVTTTEESSASKFLSGYYADVNVEWSANERTGLFGGVSAQQFGDYQQTVAGRTALIDLGSAVGIRGGITIKF